MTGTIKNREPLSPDQEALLRQNIGAAAAGGSISFADWSPVGDGVADDTAKFRGAALTAAALKAKLRIGTGVFKITELITVNGKLVLDGDGIAGDQGYGYSDQYAEIKTPSDTTGFGGTVFVCSDHSFLDVYSDEACAFTNFEVRYPTKPSENTFALRLNRSGDDDDKVNVGSLFFNVYVQNCQQGIILNECLDWVIKACHLRDCHTRCIDARNYKYPHWSDSTIDGCMLWGPAVSTTFYEHIRLQSGGGYRIVNNKINYGYIPANDACAIRFTALLDKAQIFEPLIIANNSIEGMGKGIVFTNGFNFLGQAWEITITGNQIWTGEDCIVVQKHGLMGPPNTDEYWWVNGLTIAGNHLEVANPDTGVYHIDLDGVINCNITGNTFATQSGEAAASLNTTVHCYNIRAHANLYGTDVTRPTVATPTPPATTAVVTNVYPYDVMMLIWGGDIDEVYLNGVLSIDLASDNVPFLSVPLGSGETVRIDYTGTIYWVWHVVNS